MDVDLQKYRESIAKKLLAGIKQQIQVQRKNEHKTPTPMAPLNKAVISSDPDSSGSSDSDSENEKLEFIKTMKKSGQEITGGKFNFKKIGKTLKHVGNEIGDDVKKGANMVKDTAIKTGAQMAGKEAGQYIYNGLKEAGKSMMEYAPEVAEDAGMTVAENPELMLLAAGMEEKKPKKKRKPRNLSQKEINRHKLVKALMQKYDISLPEASKLIKAKNMKY